MTFLHPILAALGLAAVALPILIHLLMHRRRKPVMWGAMRFLIEAYRRQRRRLMLEKWLLLAARCLLILLACLAIARPIIGSLAPGLLTGSGGGKTLYILIDNGIASGLVGSDGKTALDRHKAAALNLLDAMSSAAGGEGGDADRVGLITLAAPAEAVVLPASVDRGSIRELIESLTPADARTDLPGGVSLLADHLSNAEENAASERTFAAVLSEFREGSLETGAVIAALPSSVRLIATPPAEQGVDGARNVGIVSVEPMRGVVVDPALARLASSGVSGQQARVTLRRSGAAVGEAGTTAVKAELAAVVRSGSEADGRRVQIGAGTARVRWNAGQETASAVVRLEPTGIAVSQTGAGGENGASGGTRQWVLSASIDADDLPGDNDAAATLDVRESVRVGIVSPTRFSVDAAAGSLGAADRLDAGAWMRLALSPGARASGTRGEQEVEIAEIEPASLDAARLSGLDAVVIARPDLLSPNAWSVLRLMVDDGGLVIVMPPSAATVHLWSDAMTRALGLPWTLAREASVFESGEDEGGASTQTGWSIAIGKGEAAVDGGEAANTRNEDSPTHTTTQAQEDGGVLRFIRGELPELVPSVRVMKVLPMQGDLSQGEIALSLDTPQRWPLVWIGRPSSAEQASTNGTQRTESRGLVVYLGAAMDLTWTDLPAKPMMVPLMQEILRQGLGEARGRSWWIAGVTPPPSVPEQSVELVTDIQPRDNDNAAAEGSDTEIFLPIGVTETGRASSPMRRRGVWRAVDSRGQSRGMVVVNADTAGGVVTPRQAGAGRETIAAALNTSSTTVENEQDGAIDSADPTSRGMVWLAGENGADATRGNGDGGTLAAAAIFAEAEKSSPLARPMLIAALVMALVETLLARRASYAGMGSGTAGGTDGLMMGSMISAKEAA